MPLYFFHITEGNAVFHDDAGIEWPDLAAVKKAAVDGVRGLAGEAMQNGRHGYEGCIDVHDEHGTRVLTLTFEYSFEIEVTVSSAGGTTPQAVTEDADTPG